jgi:hypothetical protein
MEEQTEFEFPDELEAKAAAALEKEVSDEVELEVVDDTPEKDRGREPSEPPSEVTEEELEKYSESVQKRIKHITKGYHDERRAKEAAAREREEAVRFAQQIFEENKRLKGLANESVKSAVESEKQVAEVELERARAKFKKAYEDGDADILTAAQEEMADAKIKIDRVNSRKLNTALQEENNPVYNQDINPPAPKPDQKAVAWRDKNQWFGRDEEMTSFALGVHERLVKQGVDTSSDDYYEKLNGRIRQVFPEAFRTEVEEEKPKKAKPSNVVAPATRSTAPKKIVLTQTQVALAKRLGVPLELYAKKVAEEMRKDNG